MITLQAGDCRPQHIGRPGQEIAGVLLQFLQCVQIAVVSLMTIRNVAVRAVNVPLKQGSVGIGIVLGVTGG